MRGMSRRGVLLAAAWGGAAGLAACGGPASGPPGPERLGGDLLVWEGSEYQQLWAAARAGFQKVAPDLTVKAEALAVPQGQTADDVIIATSAAGTAADVWQHDVTPSWQQGFVEKKIVLQLDEYYARLPNLRKVLPWARSMTKIGGKTYGVPNEVEYIAVFYNKAVLDKLNVKQPPDTWDGYLKLGNTLKAAGVRPQAQNGLPNYGHMFSLLLAGRLGRAGQEDLLFKDGRWDAEGPLDAARAARDLQAAGALPANPFASDAPKMPDEFYAGAVALWMNGTWQIGGATGYDATKRNVPGFDYDHFPVPGVPKATRPQIASGLGGGWHVNAATRQRDAAAAWLDYQLAPETQRVWIESFSEVPPLPYKPEDYTVSPGFKQVLKTLAQPGDLGLNMVPLVSVTFRPFFWDTAQALLTSQIGVGEWGARLQRQWEQEKREGKVPRP
jgi:raffinose/stachyose/melibiose transport system substrate-binding protein